MEKVRDGIFYYFSLLMRIFHFILFSSRNRGFIYSLDIITQSYQVANIHFSENSQLPSSSYETKHMIELTTISSPNKLNKEKLKKSSRKNSTQTHQEKNLIPFDINFRSRKAESFRHCLNPHKEKKIYLSKDHPSHSIIYDADFIESPEFRVNRYSLASNTSGSFSIYSKSSEIKKEMNDLFHSKHPEYEPYLKFSHIRSMKARLLEVALEINIEMSTVAFSYTYFEKLFLSKLVIKSNRKLIAAACLLLATKINESKEIKLSLLLDTLDKKIGIQTDHILKCEFWAFSSLEFNLQLNELEYFPHLERLFSFLHITNMRDYLGEKMYISWKLSSLSNSSQESLS